MLAQIHFSPVFKGTTFVSEDKRVFALCNGQALPRSEYFALSAVWPVGSYGSTADFIHLPNLDNIYLRGYDYGRGVIDSPQTRTALSGTAPSGTQLGSFQVANMQSHTHPSGTGPLISYSAAGGPNFHTVSSTPGDVTSDLQLYPAQTRVTISGAGATSFDLPHIKAYPYICII